MDSMWHFIQKERRYYNTIPPDAQKLLASILLYGIISPLFDVFMFAFLFRQSQNIQIVAFYMLLVFIGIVIGFYINGILLKKSSAGALYTFGAFIQGLCVFLVVFINNTHYISVGIFGFLFGIATGIFWGNRNLLTLKTTNTDNRIYFSSIESNINTATGIIIPICIGWFIVAGQTAGVYSPIQAYRYLSVVILLFVVCIGLVLRRLMITLPPPKRLSLPHVSLNWKKFQAFEFVLGLSQGMNIFVPTLMVLLLVGKENALGSIQSLAAITAMIIVFILAKSLKATNRPQLLAAYVAFGIAGAAAFSLTYSALGVYLFYAMSAIAEPFNWIAVNSLNYDLIDEENEELHYAYVCNQEIFLNGGRITAILVFLFVAFYSKEGAIRFLPLAVAFAQILLLGITKSIKSRVAGLPKLTPQLPTD